MAYCLASPEGRRLYALCKQTPEPLFGIIKSVMGFRQFSLRGLDKIKGRVEPRHNGMERQADIRPHPRLTATTNDRPSAQ